MKLLLRLKHSRSWFSGLRCETGDDPTANTEETFTETSSELNFIILCLLNRINYVWTQTFDLVQLESLIASCGLDASLGVGLHRRQQPFVQMQQIAAERPRALHCSCCWCLTSADDPLMWVFHLLKRCSRFPHVVFSAVVFVRTWCSWLPSFNPKDDLFWLFHEALSVSRGRMTSRRFTFRLKQCIYRTAGNDSELPLKITQFYVALLATNLT